LSPRRLRLTLYNWSRAAIGVLGLALRSWRVLLIVSTVAAVGVVASVHRSAQHTVVVEINGTQIRHLTNQTSTESVLREMSIPLYDDDLVQAPSRESLIRGEPIQITVAREITLVHDGSITHSRTHAQDVSGAVRDAGVVVSPEDSLLLAGEPCSPDATLPAPEPPLRPGTASLLAAIRRPIKLAVRRAVRTSVQDGAVQATFYTSSRTVGEALYERGITIYAGDRVLPDLDTEITPGLAVYIERAKPVVLDVGGTSKMLRTRRETVRDLFQTEGLALGPNDYAVPGLAAPIGPDLHVSLVRVHEERYVEETPVLFETVWEPDPDVEIDDWQVVRWGREGASRRRIRVRYENEKDMDRFQEEEWVAREPMDRVIRYGTSIVFRELETPSGIVKYWRRLRMLATSYNAPTAGKPLDHPQYGITRMGWRARKGIVAVDPRVIALGQETYVPGYGLAVAADTGGAIKWRRIDLCFDDDNLELWRRWVDVYLLPPVPPKEEIEWVIPNWPLEKE
jgi:uncharacterized protein YabE (DUF348 family)